MNIGLIVSVLTAILLTMCGSISKKIVAGVIILALLMLTFVQGFHSGIKHTIEDSCCYIVDYDSYTDPDGNEYDLRLLIDIDNNVYERGLYVG